MKGETVKTYILIIMLCLGLVFPVSVFAEFDNTKMQNDILNDDTHNLSAIGIQNRMNTTTSSFDETAGNLFDEMNTKSFDSQNSNENDSSVHEKDTLNKEVISTAEIQVLCAAKNLGEQFVFTLVPINMGKQVISSDKLFLSDGTTGVFRISYMEPGVYRYTISQNSSDAKNIEYDNTVYTAKVEIQYVNGQYIPDVVVYRNGSDAKTDMCRFENKLIGEQEEEEKDKDKDKDKEEEKDKDKEEKDKDKEEDKEEEGEKDKPEKEEQENEEKEDEREDEDNEKQEEYNMKKQDDKDTSSYPAKKKTESRSVTENATSTNKTVNNTPDNNSVYQGSTKEVQQGVRSVQTGDTSNTAVLLVMMMMSVIVIAGCQYRKRRD